MKRILIIDDEPSIRLTFRFALNSAKWEVVEAESGRAALDLMEQDRFDLVFLDLYLPDLHGLQVLAAMREREIDTPVVLVSAHGTNSLEKEVDSIGSFGFLPKPVTPSQLRIVAERVFSEDPAV